MTTNEEDDFMSVTDAGPVSQFGEYSGFSEPRYDGYERKSFYVEVRDGTKLAIDLFRPTLGGKVEDSPLPVVWRAKRYLRATVADGRLVATLLTPDPSADQSRAPRALIEHGYVIASADMRGTGASFGTWTECSDPASSADGYDLTEWLANQPWCDGNVGMFGASYEGRMQLNAASAGPPHLKAIMPEVSPFDWYDLVHEGGIYQWRYDATGDHFRSCDVDPPVAGVDEDLDGRLLAQALHEHETTNDYSATKGGLPFRDSANSAGVQQWLERSGEALLPGIIRSGVATYQTTGFFARVGLDQLLWFSNLIRSETAGRHKIMVGPWPSGGVARATDEVKQLWATETLRFFDFWLKGIENGIMDEPKVIYTTQTSAHDRSHSPSHWKFADSWPLPGARQTDFFFDAGSPGYGPSLNDGRLSLGSRSESGADEMTVDYQLAAPYGDQTTHFSDISAGAEGLGILAGAPGQDFSNYDAACLTYTTPELENEVEVTGHPIVRLFVSSTADDGDFIVHLEDVDKKGVSTYVSKKQLRASHRATLDPGFYTCDTPWHTRNEKDAVVIPAGEIVEVAFDLLPTSYLFQRGHRIRVSVSCSDTSNARSPIVEPAPRVKVHRDDAHPSMITLPIVSTVGK